MGTITLICLILAFMVGSVLAYGLWEVAVIVKMWYEIEHTEHHDK